MKEWDSRSSSFHGNAPLIGADAEEEQARGEVGWRHALRPAAIAEHVSEPGQGGPIDEIGRALDGVWGVLDGIPANVHEAIDDGAEGGIEDAADDGVDICEYLDAEGAFGAVGAAIDQ